MPEELTQSKIEQLNKMPIVESFVTKSDDGKWVIHKTTITSIKSINYYKKMLEGGWQNEDSRRVK
ncbi:hypothetical protein HYU13_04295 [Candidatus Woesearchaeota archaeon]|nr:hypothetical protein [Candidatus Woesearchaeota archaeon]